MVESFEVTTGGLRPMGRAPHLNAASEGLPDGAYTTLRTYGGTRILRLRAHVSRLNESVLDSGTPHELSQDRLRSAIAAALGAAGHEESRLRVTFAPPRLFLSVGAFTPPAARLYRDGAVCQVVPLRRRQPRPKDTRFLARAAEMRRGLPQQVEEGLMVGEDGALLEGLSSNVFVVLEGALHTEPHRVLPGITRALVLEAAEGQLPIRLSPVGLSQLHQASECFLTSTSRGILPVSRIDDQQIGEGRPGPVGRQLQAELAALIEREAEPVLGR